MLIYTLKRLGVAVLVMFTVSLISFMLTRVSGDPAIALAGEGAGQEEIEFVRKQYGFDRPLIVQYVEWIGKALKGDLGESPYLNQPVSKMIRDRIGVTMTLGVCALMFAVIVAIPLGILAAIRPNTWIDRIALTLSVLGQAMPSFWFGLIMIIFFGVMLRWLPIFQPAIRRLAPAGGRRPSFDHAAGSGPLRRADLGAGCLGSGSNPQSTDGIKTGTQSHLCSHQPRPGRCGAYCKHGGSDVSG
jgi:ABC-type dipeptide/oligopeptide/nickel transport system permease component